MNTQTKKAPVRLNFFDILLILIVLCVLAVGAFLFMRKPTATEEVVSKRVQYTVIVKDLHKDVKLYAEPGSTVLDSSKLGEIGKLVSYKIVEAEYDAFNHETQSLVHGIYEDYYSVEFVIESEVTLAGVMYQVAGIDIVLGGSVPMRLPSFVGTGYIIDVTDVSELPADSTASE